MAGPFDQEGFDPRRVAERRYGCLRSHHVHPLPHDVDRGVIVGADGPRWEIEGTGQMPHVLDPTVLGDHQAVWHVSAQVSSIEVRHAAQREPIEDRGGERRGGRHVHAETELRNLTRRETDVRRERKPGPANDFGPVWVQQVDREVGPGRKTNMPVKQPPE